MKEFDDVVSIGKLRNLLKDLQTASLFPNENADKIKFDYQPQPGDSVQIRFMPDMGIVDTGYIIALPGYLDVLQDGIVHIPAPHDMCDEVYLTFKHLCAIECVREVFIGDIRTKRTSAPCTTRHQSEQGDDKTPDETLSRQRLSVS